MICSYSIKVVDTNDLPIIFNKNEKIPRHQIYLKTCLKK